MYARKYILQLKDYEQQLLELQYLDPASCLGDSANVASGLL